MVAEWAERVAKASSQYGHFVILVSWTCSTAVEVGSFIISGESSCSSQGIGYVNVKAGRKVLRRELFVPGIFDCRRRPLVRLATGFWLLSMLVETQGSVDDVLGLFNGRPLLMQFILLLFKFWFSLQVTAEGTIVLGSGCGNVNQVLVPRSLGEHEIDKLMLCGRSGFTVLIPGKPVEGLIVFEQAIVSV